jgi:peroxiredoxin
MRPRDLLVAPLVLSLCTALSPSALAKETVAPQVGKKIADIALKDYRGKAFALADVKDAKVVVVAFLGVECPLSKLYAPRLASLAAKYKDQGVAFIGVDSNRQDAATEMSHFATEHKVDFPLLKDLNNKLADEFGAARVPEVFVLDGERVIRYAGRVDDQYGFDTGTGYAKTRINREDLVLALDELLAGKEVSKPKTETVGCLIGRVREADNTSEVTYSKQIARIFQDRCVECHREGQIGPFALQNYDDAVGWAEMIEETVRDNRMPPWHPEKGIGHFVNDMSLSDAEKDLIYKWVAAGAPEGDAKDLPEPKQYAGEWMIPGGPDEVFYMSDKPAEVPAEGTVAYRYYVVDPKFTEDKWIKASECLPDNRGVVHHIIVFVRPPGPLFGKDNLEAEGGEGESPRSGSGNARGQAQFGMLCGFAPGTRPYVLPEGMAKMVPAGSQLVFQMHYTPNGSPAQDRSMVGIKYATPEEMKNIKYRVATANATNAAFAIPPGDANYKVESERTYGGDALMLSVYPHMHLRGKSFRYELQYPDGRTETIMNMPKYDFNWQTNYVFTEPLKLPEGTTLHCTAHFDNSAENPANPDPSVKVRWGDQTWEEMMIGWFDIAVPVDADISKVLPPRQFRRPAAKPEKKDAESASAAG